MAQPPSTLPAALWPFAMSHFCAMRRQIHKEHLRLSTRIEERQAHILELDVEIGKCKEGNKPKHAEKKIALRRTVHQWLKEEEARLSEVNSLLKSTEQVIPAAINDYARSSCLSLTRHLRARFPRELRDMVYAFLLADISVENIEKYVLAHKHNSHHPHPLLSNLKHILDPEFMDPSVIPEITHATASLPINTYTVEGRDLPALLDVMALGDKTPVSSLVRDIHIRLSMFWVLHSHIADGNSQESLWALHRYIADGNSFEPLKKGLEDLLLAIPGRRDRSLSIEIRACYLCQVKKGACQCAMECAMEEITAKLKAKAAEGEFKEVHAFWGK